MEALCLGPMSGGEGWPYRPNSDGSLRSQFRDLWDLEWGWSCLKAPIVTPSPARLSGT